MKWKRIYGIKIGLNKDLERNKDYNNDADNIVSSKDLLPLRFYYLTVDMDEYTSDLGKELQRIYYKFIGNGLLIKTIVIKTKDNKKAHGKHGTVKILFYPNNMINEIIFENFY